MSRKVRWYVRFVSDHGKCGCIKSAGERQRVISSSAAISVKVMLMIICREVDAAVAAVDVLLRFSDLVTRARAHLAWVKDLGHVVPVPGRNRRRHVMS